MIVSKLNGQIRAASPLRIAVNFAGLHIEFEVTKQSALQAVAKAFPDRKAETGLYVNEDGFFTREQNQG